MITHRLKTSRLRASVGLTAALALSLAAAPAFAQLAPTGPHHAGAAPAPGEPVSHGGGYASSVPLDLPAPRNGLPVPLEIVNGAHRVGAAGLGWHVPLSYVRVLGSLAHRRPKYSLDLAPVPRGSVVLSLGGRSLQLVQKGSTWVSQRDAPELVLQQQNGGWVLYDGHGNTYTFAERPEIAGSGMYLLASIVAPGGANTVALDYEIVNHAFSGGAGVAIDLKAVRYDTHPSQSCSKYELTLGYGGDVDPPLSIDMLDPLVLVRTRTLRTVDVKSRADCVATPQIVRSYELTYLPGGDPDTKLPLLEAVRVHGREGTPESSSTLPVASYEYGTATNAGKLVYQKSDIVALPQDVPGDQISTTTLDSTLEAPSGNEYATWQNLMDVTGDGLPDVVFEKNGELWVALNRPAASGSTMIGAAGAEASLADAALGPGPFEMHSSAKVRYQYGSTELNPDEVWRRVIDVNGDGRPDIVDAREEKGKWVVYLNTPGAGASGVTWKRWTWSTGLLRSHLAERHHTLDPDYIPLERRQTGRNQTYHMCWKYNGTKWVLFPEGACSYPAPWTPVGEQEDEETFVDWELTDVNGDGYPDFVVNSSPVEFAVLGALPPSGGTGEMKDGNVTYHIGPRDDIANRVDVLFNVVGVRIDEGATPFSAPVPLDYGASCGVESWVQKSDGDQEHFCGIQDVNGDGLLDRIVNKSAALGTGSAFSNVVLTLPGPLARHNNEHRYFCELPDPDPPGSTKYPASNIMGLRDLTGDGIPDYIQLDHTGWHVSIGTGTGFAPSIPIDGPFSLSGESETCDGLWSGTLSGLYDINGDGKPDVVSVGAGTLGVYELTGSSAPGTPEAGRLVSIDNGFGAKTTIGYRSAKKDGTTPHQVPSPEIVVTSVETTGTLGLGGDAAATRFAYGDAELVFDPALDAFTSTGYGRSVEVRVVNPKNGMGTGTATITDAHGLDPFSLVLSKQQSYARYAMLGRPTDVTGLSGTIESDPWALLTVDTTSDPRRTSGMQYGWDTRSVHQAPLSGENPVDCTDVPYPYDWPASFGANQVVGYDVCATYGFGFEEDVDAWRGDQAPPSAANIETHSGVLAVDEYGQALSVLHHNDIHRGDDDVCELLAYATPAGAGPRVLGALKSRQVTDCGKGMTYAGESWEYDELPPGSVKDGLPTSHTVEVRDTDTGALLRTIRESDVAYDSSGNPTDVLSEREDGATREISYAYDTFGLAIVTESVEATDAATLTTLVKRDPVTLDVIATSDPIGTTISRDLDGFGRVVRLLAAPAGAAPGVTASTTYLGFAGGDPLGRRVITKSFTDPVPPANVGATEGQTGTLYLDELGRTRRVETGLGSSYAGETLVVRKTYDTLGRPTFVSDPYAQSQDPATAYGTSHFYNADNSPSCSVRGYGPQTFTNVTNEASEIYPTCYERSFAGNAETVGVRDAASLLGGSAQNGVVTSATSTAIGRMLSRQTYKGATRLEYATFAYDHLGAMNKITRYQNAGQGSNPVAWTAGLDSLGQKRYEVEPESAQRNYTYSDFGELLSTRWTDAGVARSVEQTYDGLGRVTSRADFSGGLIVPETAYDYFYDAATSPVPGVTTTNVLGRLSYATSPTGDTYLGYDAFGRVNVRAYTDLPGDYYVEKSGYRFDGNRSSLELLLPDDAHASELIAYNYDSAARLRTVKYTAGKTTFGLFNATQIDAWGRPTTASYGDNVTHTASFANVGRRLPIDAKVSSSLGARKIQYMGFDPVGRERSRREFTNNAATGPATTLGYDALGRLASATQANGAQVAYSTQFGYDALGNVLSLSDTATTLDATLSYNVNDRDRACRIGYGDTGLGGTACNVVYDGVGNVVSEPTRSGVTRQLDYYPSGLIRKIKQGNALASFRHDPFGDVAQLDITGTNTDARHDRRFGAFIERHDASVNGAIQSVVYRRIPGVHGMLATRAGAAGPWIFRHAEHRGERFFTDETGAFAQEVSYRPFGEATSTIAATSSLKYTHEQWNDGDALAAFGLSQLGARIYDPVIGRFLSRDPLMVVRTAAATNPYAFAGNDPMNASDPTGLDKDGCAEGNCGGSGGLDLMFGYQSGRVWRKYPAVQKKPWFDPSLNPADIPYFSAPVYESTFDLEHGYEGLSPQEKQIFDKAFSTAEGDWDRMRGRAFLDVGRYRYDHRFDKMAFWKGLFSKGAEQYEIDRAQDRRIVLSEDDRAQNLHSASLSPALVGRNVYEVVIHGNPRSIGVGHESPDISVEELIGTLEWTTQWEPGMPIVLASCNGGVPVDDNYAQALANASGSVVYAPSGFLYYGGDYPLMSPAGWTVFWPKK